MATRIAASRARAGGTTLIGALSVGSIPPGDTDQSV
jgi:hypothetical protein